MNDPIAFIDLFAGIGGFRLGLERCNTNRKKTFSENSLQSKWNKSNTKRGTRGCDSYRCIWSNDWNKYCATIYEKNFGEAPDTRDIREIPSKDIPDHDLLCAGFPCQAFSVAGKGAGFEDTRGTLFFEIARVLRDKRPRHFLLENVKGLLSHQAGETFQTMLGVLAGLGYRCEWQVLNSRDFGVPQNRERVFIVGHIGGEPWKQVFPIGEGKAISPKKNERTSGRNKVASALTEDYRKVPLNRGESYVIHDKRQAGEFRIQKEPSVTKHYGTGGGNVPLVVGNIYPGEGQAGQVFDPEGISKAIVPAKRGGSAVMPIVYDDYNHRVREDGNCGAVRQTFANKALGNGCKLIAGGRIRRLTPTECERLQGFPDGWTEGVSDTQRYKMLGNAVTVNVVEAIGRRLREVLG